MRFRTTDAFDAGLSPAEREFLRKAEPETFTVIGWTHRGRGYQAELLEDGAVVGRGEHETSPALAVAAALADQGPAAADHGGFRRRRADTGSYTSISAHPRASTGPRDPEPAA